MTIGEEILEFINREDSLHLDRYKEDLVWSTSGEEKKLTKFISARFRQLTEEAVKVLRETQEREDDQGMRYVGPYRQGVIEALKILQSPLDSGKEM